MERPDRLLTRREIARWLRIRPERIEVLIRDHGLPVINLPRGKRRSVRFSRPSVEAWLRSREDYLPE
ncbi:helix-turn-helix domain-containing protein [Haloferula sp. A504]|uniref:helix-turn-helix domain-containing protein n=1 Tax=Haloferula sp. A504 TaxID=3373601 RepID=UPI0037880442